MCSVYVSSHAQIQVVWLHHIFCSTFHIISDLAETYKDKKCLCMGVYAYAKPLICFSVGRRAHGKGKPGTGGGWMTSVPHLMCLLSVSTVLTEEFMELMGQCLERYKWMSWACIKMLEVFPECRGERSTSCASYCAGLILPPQTCNW